MRNSHRVCESTVCRHGSTAKAAVQHKICCCLPWSGCDVHLGRSRLCSARCTFLLCTRSQSLNMPYYQLLLASWPGQTPAMHSDRLCLTNLCKRCNTGQGCMLHASLLLAFHAITCIACEATLTVLAMHLHDTVICEGESKRPAARSYPLLSNPYIVKRHCPLLIPQCQLFHNQTAASPCKTTLLNLISSRLHSDKAVPTYCSSCVQAAICQCTCRQIALFISPA